jgi:hypothetical protein
VRRSRAGIAAIGIAAAFAAPPAPRSAAIAVGPNVLVSRDDAAHPHQEVQIGAHPTDPKKLVACSMVDVDALSQRKMHTAVYVSADGGKTWTIGPTIPESGDPVCDFGPDGAAYFGAIGDSPTMDPAIDWHFNLYRSADGGKDWKLLSDILTGDRPWLAFDASSGPNHGWLYVTYQSRAGVLDSREKGATVSLDLTHSADQGKTWSLPRAYGVITGQRLLHSLPTMMATLSDGTVVISNWQNLKRRAVADEDGAAAPYPGLTGPATCEVAVVLVDPDGWKRPTIHRAAEKYCGESPTVRTVDALAVDVRSEAFRDRIYVAWTDERSGHARILFTASSDRGLTWSKPRAVDDPPAGLAHAPDNFMPTLAVNKDGVVGLTWYDRRENPDNIGYVARFAASLDGGETWLPSVRVSEQAAQFRPGAGEGVGAYVEEAGEAPGPLTLHVYRAPEPSAGDTAGLRADADGVFHAVWVDNRSGRGEVYTASVTVAGTVARHGSPDLAALADVSGRVAVDLTDVVYDPKTRRVTVEASVRNKSAETLRGRLVGRLLSVDSEAGRASVLDADNGASGAGATFDFTASVPEGGLQPKQSTRPKTLRFELKDVRVPPLDPKEPWKALRVSFLDVDIQVLGEAPPPAEKKEQKENR